MTTPQFSWDSLEDAPGKFSTPGKQDPKAQVEQAKSFSWESVENADKPPSKVQEIASSAPVQLGLGLAKAVTYPADIMKMMGRAELLQELEDLEERGIPIDRKKYLEGMEKALEAFPTQELAEKGFEKATGVSLEPKESIGKFARTVGEYANPKKLSEGLARKAISAVAGAGTEQLLEAAGAPPIVAVGAGALTSGKISAPKTEKALSKEAQELEKIAEQHGLRKFQGMFEEKAPTIKPVVSEKKMQKAEKQLAESGKKAIEEVIAKKVPLAQKIKEGHSPKELYTDAYEIAYDKAKDVTRPINMGSFVEWADKKIASIQKSVPSLGPNEEKILDMLRKEREVFANQPMASAEQLLNQYKNYHERVRGIFRKPEFSGIEERVKDLHLDFNKQILNAIERSGEASLNDAFKVANNIYSENQKINRAYNILEPGLKDPTKLDKILSTKKAEFLKRDLGKEAFDDLKDISKYSQKAREKVFDVVKVKPNFVESMKDWGKILSYLTFDWTGLSGVTTLEGLTRLKGHLFMKDSSRKSYTHLLRAISSGSESAIKRYAKELDNSVQKEWGSVDNFFDSMEDF